MRQTSRLELYQKSSPIKNLFLWRGLDCLCWVMPSNLWCLSSRKTPSKNTWEGEQLWPNCYLSNIKPCTKGFHIRKLKYFINHWRLSLRWYFKNKCGRKLFRQKVVVVWEKILPLLVVNVQCLSRINFNSYY